MRVRGGKRGTVAIRRSAEWRMVVCLDRTDPPNVKSREAIVEVEDVQQKVDARDCSAPSFRKRHVNFFLQPFPSLFIHLPLPSLRSILHTTREAHNKSFKQLLQVDLGHERKTPDVGRAAATSPHGPTTGKTCRAAWNNLSTRRRGALSSHLSRNKTPDSERDCFITRSHGSKIRVQTEHYPL